MRDLKDVIKIQYSNCRTLIYYDTKGNKFELGCSAFKSMVKYIQDVASKDEAGGVLLGRYILNSKHVVVDTITVPSNHDQRLRHFFFRSAKKHQIIIDNFWLSSDGTCNYLGEWHTHPESDPVPSSRDISEWQRKLQADKYDSDCLFYVIVGTRKINAWKGLREGGILEKLKQFY